MSERRPPPQPTARRSTARPLRADAARNRQRVLGAAQDAFAELGLEASLDEIARRAGVGAGTVHRNFPSKETLYEAVILANHAEVLGSAVALSGGHGDGDAFFVFFAEAVERAMVNRGLAEAMIGAGVELSPSIAAAGDRFMAILGPLVKTAQRAGVVRRDVHAIDVKAVFVGVVAASIAMGLNRTARSKLVDIAADGLRRA